MAKSFDTQFRELVLAVTMCNFENVQRILASDWYERNCIKIMGKGRNVGFIGIPMTIHNIAQCWEMLLKVDDMSPEFLKSYHGEIERLHKNNKAIINLLKHKFTGGNDTMHFERFAPSIPYGVFDEDDFEYEREELKEYNLREIDEELVLSLCAYDLNKFEELITYGANPWANLGEDDCVWERIVCRSTCMINELLHQILEPSNRINLPELLEDLVSSAGYECFDRLLQGYMPFESEIKSSPIKTIPRIVYTSNDGTGVLGSIAIEVAYDQESDKTEYKNFNRLCSDSEVVLQPKAIKSLLAPESIDRFTKLVLQPSDEFVFDGGSYTMKMIDANGNIKEIECDDSDKKQVPHIVFLEKYAKAMRKEINAKFE